MKRPGIAGPLRSGTLKTSALRLLLRSRIAEFVGFLLCLGRAADSRAGCDRSRRGGARLALLLDGGRAAEDAVLFLDGRRGILREGRRAQNRGGKNES